MIDPNLLYSFIEIVAAIIIFIKVLNNKMKSLDTKVENMRPKIEQMHYQLSPNSGTSVLDAVKRIDNNVKDLNRKLMSFEQIYSSPLFKTDKNGKFEWINLEFSKLLGVSIFDIRGDRWLSLVHPEDRERVKDDWNNTFENSGVFHSEFRMVNMVNRSQHKILASAIPVPSEDGTLEYLGSLSSITS